MRRTQIEQFLAEKEKKQIEQQNIQKKKEQERLQLQEERRMEKLRYAELQKKEYEKRLNHTRYVLEQSIEKMEKDIEEKQKHSEDKLHELLLIKEKLLKVYS